MYGWVTGKGLEDVQSGGLCGREMEELDKNEGTAVGWEKEVVDVRNYSVCAGVRGLEDVQSGVQGAADEGPEPEMMEQLLAWSGKW
jgi:hypothetical protein